MAVKFCRKADYRAFNIPSDNSDTIAHFLASVMDLFEHALRDVEIPIWWNNDSKSGKPK